MAGLPVGHEAARPDPEAEAPGAPKGPRAGKTGDLTNARRCTLDWTNKKGIEQHLAI